MFVEYIYFIINRYYFSFLVRLSCNQVLKTELIKGTSFVVIPLTNKQIFLRDFNLVYWMIFEMK